MLTKLFSNTFNEIEKIYIYSPSLHQNTYRKTECPSNYIQKSIIPNILKEENTDLVNDEVVNDEDFKKSDTKIEAYENIKELKFLQDSKDHGTIKLDDIKDKKLNKPRVQTMFKRS